VIEALDGWAAEGVHPGECALLHVAHSLPEKLDRQGDPYLGQTRATVRAVHGRVAAALVERGHGRWWGSLPGGGAPALAFQSRVGPIRWLGPEVTAETKRLAEAGCRRLMVQPVSFTCEHIETLMELDIELREVAETAGIGLFRRGPALNLEPCWLESMAAELMRRAFDKEVDSHA
jgi:ferrochelatase